MTGRRVGALGLCALVAALVVGCSSPGDGGYHLTAYFPRAVALYRARPDGTPRNVWRGEVEGVDLQGDRVRVRVNGPVPLVAEVTRGAMQELGLSAGAGVWLVVKATEVSVYPA